MHSRNSVRYYLILAALVTFLFFTNDFGLIDIQKTAIVMAVGIDREGPTFILTTQIAVPQSSDQGEQAQAVQIESRGETIADAFNQINAKTGWYPKLVFCNLVVLGEQMIKSNVFDALDFFLRDEYMSDKCLVAACEGTAKEILNTKTPIDPMSGVAAQKVLSDHAARVGTVASNTLREFAMGYFSYSKSGYLPVLKPEKQQESSGENGGGGGEQQQSSEGGGERARFWKILPSPPRKENRTPLRGIAPSPRRAARAEAGRAQADRQRAERRKKRCSAQARPPYFTTVSMRESWTRTKRLLSASSKTSCGWLPIRPKATGSPIR